MSIIKQHVPFGDKRFVERQCLSNLEYNSSVEWASNCKVLIENCGSKTKTELYRSGCCCFNPKPKGLGNLFKKIDPSTYIVLFISSAPIDGSCGGNIQCKNGNIKELQYEKVFYTWSYQFKVVDPKRFVEALISEGMDQYSRDYFKKKIEQQTKLRIEEKISKAIDTWGIERFCSNVVEVKKEIETELAEEEALDDGIELSILSLTVQEDPVTKAKREDTELRKYQKNMSKEEQ